MKLSHNMASLRIYNHYEVALKAQSKAMERISSGSAVNSAMDNPYAITQDNMLNMQLSGLQVASQNSQSAISLLQTTEGALDGMNSMISRMRELAVQAGNSTVSDADKQDIQMEISKLSEGVNNLAQSTSMNGVNLINGSSSSTVNSLIGANVGDNISIPTYNLQSSNLKDASGNSLAAIDVTTAGGVTKALDVLDASAKVVVSANSIYGALENRLSTNITNVAQLSLDTQTADSNVMDADIAEEMLNYSKNSIITQAGNAMIAQTNQFPKDVLSILKNVK